MKLLSALVSLRFTLVYVISELYFHTNIDRNNAIMSESSKRKILFSLSTVPLVLITSALLTEFKPQPIQKNIITKSFDIKPLQKGTPFTLFNWNIQYAGSRRHHFFYDGGSAVRVPENDVRESILSIKEEISKIDPDIILLQEVDRDSHRTHRIDQLREIVSGVLGLSWTSTPYHKASFVPAPFGNPLGRVELHEAILSKFEIATSQRIQLSLLNEPRWRQMFNLKRAILATTIPIQHQNMHLHVATTHLSAFSFGDGTLDKQVDKLLNWIQSLPPNAPWILAGDFNLLPPTDDPNRLEDGEKYYQGNSNPLQKLSQKYKNAITSENYTYQPFGQKPDRKIDYVFYGGPISMIESSVISSDTSDHLPMCVKFVLQ